jgi:putative autotransporter adhesin-like protein
MAMKKSTLAVGVLLLVFVLAGCDSTSSSDNPTGGTPGGGPGGNSEVVKGSGKISSDTRAVTGATGVSLNTSGNLTIKQGSSDSLTIEAEDNILPVLSSDLSGSRLILTTKSGATVNPTKPITYNLTLKSFTAIKHSGSGTVQISGISGDQLTIAIGGSGDITASGTATNQIIEIPGSGSYHGENLTSKSATITISGSGSANVKVSDTLNVTISGKGSVNYTGNPAVTKQVTGTGSVNKK